MGAKRALRALAGFTRALKLKFRDLDIGFDFEPERGLADSGDLDTDLIALLEAVGAAARERDTAVVIFIDELQYVPESPLASLITALHSASQDQLPITMVAAGLPQLFEFARVDRLNDASAREALLVPAARADVNYSPGAIVEILEQTRGYPYFLQEWGKQSWNVAAASPIRTADAERATVDALAELDGSFFRVRFDRLTPAEKRYMRAMAELGPGPHRSGDIADTLCKKVTTVAPLRNSLIAKGMIYSPAHGDTAFTVPLFDVFMRRIMP